MTDIVERFREYGDDPQDVSDGEWAEWSHKAASEIERLRLSLSEALAERDAAFEMSKCECGPDEACRNLVEARATGRREGLSEAAEIADEHAAEDKLEAKILREIKDYARAKQLDCESESCQRIAAAIRAAMESST